MWKADDEARSGQEGAAIPAGGARPGSQAGGSIVITGELKASEDLTIEGQVDGRIELLQNVLTIGQNAKTRAEIVAKSVVVLGEVVGNITASEKVEIRESGSVEGDIVSPRLAVADGATFCGRVDMNRGPGQGARPAAATAPAKKAEATQQARPAVPAEPAAQSR